MKNATTGDFLEEIEPEDEFLNARLFDGHSILERLAEVMAYQP